MPSLVLWVGCVRRVTDLLLTFLLTIISDRELCFGFNNVLFSTEVQYFPTHAREASTRRQQPDLEKQNHEVWRDEDGKGKAHQLTGWSAGAGDQWLHREAGRRKEGMQRGEVQTGA